MVTILIKKDPNKWENIPVDESTFQPLIESVDLWDIIQYIISAINETWAPYAYWKAHNLDDIIPIGELEWVIYSYLVHNKLLIIEDKYYGYSESRTKIYIDRLSYYNPLEETLYKPIINRLTRQKYLSVTQEYVSLANGQFTVVKNNYKLGTLYHRISNLDKIL